VIWLVRHAQPLVDAGVCYGALDLAADPKATLVAAQALADALPRGVALHTSPLQRCELLAKTICGLRPDFSYKLDPRLREMNFGQWEGVRWSDMPAAAITAWTDDFWLHRFGGAESVVDVMARVAAKWAEAMQADQDQVWITHAGVIRAVTLIARGITELKDSSQWPVSAPGYGTWITLA
jgi:alpha-ribazole phosphatase